MQREGHDDGRQLVLIIGNDLWTDRVVFHQVSLRFDQELPILVPISLVEAGLKGRKPDSIEYGFEMRGPLTGQGMNAPRPFIAIFALYKFKPGQNGGRHAEPFAV